MKTLMKKINKQILEAVNKGIQLALDDYQDIENNNSISYNDIVSVDPNYFPTYIKFKELIKRLESEALNLNYKNRDKATMTISDILFLGIYSRTIGIKYKVKTREQLIEIIRYIVGEYTEKEKFVKGIDNFADLNWIDVSEIEDLSTIFAYLDFYGDISKWDVSHAKNMFGMFMHCPCTITELYDWDVSNVETMEQMFCYSKFNQDISKWDVSNVKDMKMMFYGNKEFAQDLSSWNVSNVEDKQQIWSYTKMAREEYSEYRPKFKN